MIRNLKEKAIGTSGSVSGIASVLGSWQICHNICLWLITVLSLIGITVVGMPLVFLTKIAVPLWSIAFLLLIATFILYNYKKCISVNLLIMNTGLVIAGFPFKILESYLPVFWIVGGLTALSGLLFFIKEKIKKKSRNNKRKKYFFGLAILIIVLVVLLGFFKTQNKEEQEIFVEEDVFKTISTGSTEMGDVLIELTPKFVSNQNMVMNINANTHSVDLSQFDLVKITTLEYDGKIIKPTSVLNLGGHHSSGEIAFKVEKEIKSFKVKIKGIPNIEERIFEWN